MGCGMILSEEHVDIAIVPCHNEQHCFSSERFFSSQWTLLEACRNDNLCPICPRPQEGLFNDEPPPAIIIIAHCWPLSAPRQIVPAFPFQPYPGNGRYFDCSNWNIMKEDQHNQEKIKLQKSSQIRGRSRKQRISPCDKQQCLHIVLDMLGTCEPLKLFSAQTTCHMCCITLAVSKVTHRL